MANYTKSTDFAAKMLSLAAILIRLFAAQSLRLSLMLSQQQ